MPRMEVLILIPTMYIKAYINIFKYIQIQTHSPLILLYLANWGLNGAVFRISFAVFNHSFLTISNNYAVLRNSIIYVYVGLLEVYFNPFKVFL